MFSRGIEEEEKPSSQELNRSENLGSTSVPKQRTVGKEKKIR
jgi:hypothetical protein